MFSEDLLKIEKILGVSRDVDNIKLVIKSKFKTNYDIIDKIGLFNYKIHKSVTESVDVLNSNRNDYIKNWSIDVLLDTYIKQRNRIVELWVDYIEIPKLYEEINRERKIDNILGK